MSKEFQKNTRKSGDDGEDLACEFITNLGYEIIERNFFYGHGEIDIIAKDNDTLVFIEVKLRKNLEFGMPEYAITKTKQNQIRKIAEAYLFQKEIKEQVCRIDVVAILQLKDREPQINHIINAF